MRRLTVALLLVASFGFIGGLYFPKHAEAAVTLYTYFLPPSDPAGTNTRLTTGFHSTLALDWDDTVNSYAYGRYYAYSPDVSPALYAYANAWSGPWEGCNINVWHTVYDIYDLQNKFSLAFVHTESPQFYVYYMYFQNTFYLKAAYQRQ